MVLGLYAMICGTNLRLSPYPKIQLTLEIFAFIPVKILNATRVGIIDGINAVQPDAAHVWNSEIKTSRQHPRGAP
jgi:hypothetical protein